MKKIIIALSLLSAGSTFGMRKDAPYSQWRIAGAVMASAIGDAMGRVTEFIPTTDQIFQRYPSGIHSFNDFTVNDWENIPCHFKQRHLAPYTDDTAMARLVIQSLISTSVNKNDINALMSDIALRFITDQNSTLGWAAGFRAPGRACLHGVNNLSNFAQNGSLEINWRKGGAATAGGCGSVMRAYPFGIAFAHDPQKAAYLAAQHSLLTHGHPMAQAACAAMAMGTALALTNASPEHIISEMITSAAALDKNTAEKMNKAYAYSLQAKEWLNLNKQTIYQALQNKSFRDFHEKVFNEFAGWAADDAIAATAYAFALYPDDIKSALYVSVHTPGDSDSIASMTGALVGARVRIDAIPQKWIQQLENSDELLQEADSLASLKWKNQPQPTITRPYIALQCPIRNKTLRWITLAGILGLTLYVISR